MNMKFYDLPPLSPKEYKDLISHAESYIIDWNNNVEKFIRMMEEKSNFEVP